MALQESARDGCFRNNTEQRSHGTIKMGYDLQISSRTYCAVSINDHGRAIKLVTVSQFFQHVNLGTAIHVSYLSSHFTLQDSKRCSAGIATKRGSQHEFNRLPVCPATQFQSRLDEALVLPVADLLLSAR